MVISPLVIDPVPNAPAKEAPYFDDVFSPVRKDPVINHLCSFSPRFKRDPDEFTPVFRKTPPPAPSPLNDLLVELPVLPAAINPESLMLVVDEPPI